MAKDPARGVRGASTYEDTPAASGPTGPVGGIIHAVTGDKVRIDKWLWAARFFKTRSLATEAVAGGRVHMEGQRVKPAKEVRVGDISLGQKAWPTKPTQIANTYSNQFELPVLFYAVVTLALITRQADFLFVVLAWVFVASRLVHAAIYTTTNNIMRRFQAFVFGALVLMAMWIVFAAKLFLAA